MNRLNAIFHTLDNKMNPIAVKELRQISRGKFLPVILISFLFAQLAVTAAVAFRGSASPGPDLYRTLLGWLTGVCVLLIPMYAGFRLAQERADMNKDLLFISTLKPASIVWGKTLSAGVLAALIYSVCMPFIAMTHILRGVDLLSAFLNIVLSFLFTLTAIQAGVLVGGMPVNRFLKGIAGLLGLLPLYLILMSGPILPRFIGGPPASMSFQEALLAALLFLWIWGMPSVGFFLLSAAFLSAPSANRAFVPRIYVTAIWAASYIPAFVWDQIHRNEHLIMWWFALSCVGFGWALAVGVSERDELGPRIRQTIPRSRGRRVLAFLFYSGSAGGFLWASAGIVMTFLLFLGAFAASSGWMGSDTFFDGLYLIGFLSFNAWSIALCAVFIHRKFLKNRVSGAYTWLIAVGVHILSNLLWMMFLIGSGAYSGGFYTEWIGVLLLGAAAGSENPPTAVAGVIALVMGCACVPWLVRRASAFKPLPLKAAETKG